MGSRQAARPRPPRESALGILLCRNGPAPGEVLFGRRAPRSRFMPGHLAFPGGGLDPADEPERDGAYARCASREIAEEVGVHVDPAAWHDIGERITPPIFPIRYRTRFFVGAFPDGAVLPAEPPSPDEIDSLRFAPAATVLEEWERGTVQVPPPCLPLLRVIAAHPDLPLERLAAELRETNRAEQRFPRIEFVPGIWVLPVQTRTLPPATHTNVWMPGARRFVVIDPGSDEPQELERLLGVIERRRALGCEPAGIVLTHQHPDHVAGVRQVASALGVEVRAHPEVLDALSLGGDVPASRPLDEGDEIDLGGMTLRVRHTPGHARGHLALEVLDRDVLLAGDLLSGVSTILIHPPDGDMATYLATLRRIAAGPYRRLLPAHGPPLPRKAIDKVIAHRLEREGRVRAALSAEWTPLATIARAAYPDVPDLPAPLAEGQTLAHLLHLGQQGLARRDDADDRLWRAAGGQVR